MFQNAIEKINKFYELDLNKNSHADEMFEVLNEIIPFNQAAIFYLTPNKLTLEFGKNFEIFEDINIDEQTSTNLYNKDNITKDIKSALNIKTNLLTSHLIVKGAVLGIIVLTRKTDFTAEETIIFKTCTNIISALIKDLELSKILKLQAAAMAEGISETQKAYNTIKKQNKKIKANEKLQNQFIANVSHDLRTPLNSIIGFSEVLESKIFGELNQKQEDYINDIRVSSIRLLGMINEILDIAKLESHTIKLNLSNIDLKQLVTEVCNILNPLLEKKKINIITNIKHQIEFTGDYIKLQQVLFNIIGNAIKFSPTNSEIQICTSKTKNHIEISIKDEGIGIDKKHHKKIFNKFYQVCDTLSKTEASTGLGLTIAKEFVKLHKGTITINSELNKGTEFIISLPKK